VRSSHGTTELILVVEAAPGAVQRLAAALGAAPVSALSIEPQSPGAPIVAEHAQALLVAARERGITVSVVDDARLARVLRADGVFLSLAQASLAGLAEAREIIGRGGLVGVEAGVTRHEAMQFAEAGADYLAFARDERSAGEDAAAEREAWLARLEWWAEIFEVPCLALGIESVVDAADVAATGAEYGAVAVRGGERLDAMASRLAGIAEAFAGGARHERGGRR
jgi:thiamine-phosphate pyrophosphorylase